MFLSRNQKFLQSANYSMFLWGARQTGKSTLLKMLYPDALMLNLLESDVYQDLVARPHRIREIAGASNADLIIVDEIQKIPILLNEVHSMIENTGKRFILSGSSPRKIIRSQQNLLGGRTIRYELYPLTSDEIPDFNLERALNFGLLPRHYLDENPGILLANYVKSYLEDEIYAESRIRNLSVFSNFLYNAAFSNGEMVNYSNIASDCGVSSPTVKEYFQILVDTMIGNYVYPYQKRPKRKTVSTPKFYFFDIGVVNYLMKRKHIVAGTEVYGLAFEHFIFMELKAYSHYSMKNYDITFWRTKSGVEVDFILGENQVALEVKSSSNITNRHLRGIKSFTQDYRVQKALVISHERFPRLVGDILILPWQEFLKRLWEGEII